MIHLPPDWSSRTLGDLASFAMGQAPPSADTNTEGIGTPFYRSGEFGPQRPVTRIWTTRSHPMASSRDVFLCVVGANSGAVNLGADGVIGRSVAAITPNEELDQHYLFHYLTSLTTTLRAGTQGSAQGVITKADLRAIDVPFPSFEEQLRIVEILEDHLSRLEAAENYASAASRRLVSLHESNLRTALADYEAEYRPLGELLAVPLSNGRSVPTRDGGFPVLRLTAIKPHGVDLRERKGGAWTASEARRFLVSEGDFLITRGNGSKRLVGRGSLVRHHPDPVAFPDTIIRARPNPEVLRAEFLDHLWNSHGPRRQIESMARTTAGIYKVNQKQLALVQVPVPPLDVQSKIAARACSSRTAIDGVAGSIESAEHRSHGLRRAVLAAAFRGKLTGRHTDKEVIEELAEIPSSHSELSVTV